jgi:predicted metal-dependent HD superfamily phosphohydrolase
MKILYLVAINRAKQLLTDNPFDVYHTLEHHSEVVENVFDIIKQEKITIDTQLLEIAAWWHDVFKDNPQEDELLKKEFLNLGLDKDVQNIYNIINGHSFGQEQHSLEAKLLYDADKVALVSIARWKYAFDQYDSGLISKEERDKYVPEWNRRMPMLEDKLNFTYSNQLFKQRYSKFIKWLKSIGRYQNNLMI